MPISTLNNGDSGATARTIINAVVADANTAKVTQTITNGVLTTAPSEDAVFDALALKEAIANKDATGGYAGLTLFKINFKNVLNTITSFFTNSNTVARTYTFQNRDGTIADDADLALKQVTLVSATNIKTINGTTILGAGDLVVGGLGAGSATGNTTYWDGSAWVLNNNNIFNAGSKVTIQTLTIGLGGGALGGNTALGFNALNANTIGDFNTALGRNALVSNLTGDHNIAIGSGSLQLNSSGPINIAIGNTALQNNSTGQQNTAIGYGALNANLTGGYNNAIGTNALHYNLASLNNAMGSSALIANTTGSSNTAIGHASLTRNTTGQENVGLGYLSLSYTTTGVHNLGIGSSAGVLNATGSNNVFIGSFADASANNLSNAIAIGYQAIVSASNSMVLGNGVNVGMGISTPTAKTHVFGAGATSGTFALKVENSSGTNIISARNDGLVTIPNLADLPPTMTCIFSNFAPVDATTYYFFNFQVGLTTTTTPRRFKFSNARNITRVLMELGQTTNGSNETVTLYLHNVTTATDQTIGTFTSDFGATTVGSFEWASLALTTNTTDYYTIKILCPTWGTNPNWAIGCVLRLFN